MGGDHVFVDKFNEKQATFRSSGIVSYLPDVKHCHTADIVASGMASGTTQGNRDIQSTVLASPHMHEIVSQLSATSSAGIRILC
jgi:hypothetical protein